MKVIDSNRYEKSEIKSDVCIIGAGPAGMTLAYALQKSGLDIVIAESGGQKFEKGVNELNHIDIDSNFSYRNNKSERNRQIGGSGNLWVGRVVPFRFDQELDSEWGELRYDLETRYDDAFRLFGIDPRIREEAGNSAEELYAFWSLKTERFTLSSKWLSNLASCRLFQHLTLVGEPEFKNSRVQSFSFSNQGRKKITIHSKSFVFAMGGIENSRMLMVCADRLRERTGISFDRVGRFIMDHPRIWHGKLTPREGANMPGKYQLTHSTYGLYKIGLRKSSNQHGVRVYCNLMKTPGRVLHYMQQLPIRGLHASSKWLVVREKGVKWLVWNELMKSLPSFGTSKLNNQLRHFENTDAGDPFSLMTYCEQRPRQENRIQLVDDADSFGIPKAKLRNYLHQEELDEVACFLRNFIKVARNRNYEFDYDPDFVTDPSNYTDASHVMGGTRYSVDSSRAVLNRDLALPGVPNLHVTGSSVFPTGSVENPTHLILCLSLYLSDVIKKSFR